MILSKRDVLVFIVLVAISTLLTLYTVTAYSVARFAGDGYWSSAPPGSFFPWSRRPGMLEILSNMNEVDLFIYRYLIKSLALVGFTVISWIVTSLYFLRKTVGFFVKKRCSTRALLLY
jgi:hypothetical protein